MSNSVIKVLLVDDSVSHLDKVASLLKEKGFSVLTASNGKEGLDVIENTEDIDIVITDLNMPIMDGITMVEKIRGGNNLTNVPICILTSQANDRIKKRAKELMVIACIVKPIEPSLLADVIKQIVKK